jgi:Fatty acid hydroxylase
VYTLLKSEVGPFPAPHYPRGVDVKAEDRRARRRLYPVTIVYAILSAAILGLVLRGGHAWTALGFAALAAASWVPLEYLYHRYLLHGIFPNRGGVIRRTLHRLFDASHADHHARPWDGMYINGHVDSLFFAVVAVPLSFLAPHYTLPVFVAGLLACYTAEEWTHHALHFCNFRWAYFQHIRRRHIFHHTRHGMGVAYGISSGIWDVVAGTSIPAQHRRSLSPRPRGVRPGGVPASPLGGTTARA